MYTVLQICASFIIVGQVKCFVFNQYTKETPHPLSHVCDVWWQGNIMPLHGDFFTIANP